MPDSLGKKTHLPHVVYLFSNAAKIWSPKQPIELTAAAKVLEQNEAIRSAFRRNEWPFDTRAVQAYVHRFFRWIELSPEEQRDYPTVILSAEDSVALRQCLWIDFVHETAEAPDAIDGLYRAIRTSGGVFELSSHGHCGIAR